MKCTFEFKSEFETSQNLKYHTEYNGKTSYVGVVMYEGCSTQGQNGAAGGAQTWLLYPNQQSWPIYIIITVHVL